jgi:hypothetical protein
VSLQRLNQRVTFIAHPSSAMKHENTLGRRGREPFYSLMYGEHIDVKVVSAADSQYGTITKTL